MGRDDLSQDEVASLTGSTEPPAGQAAGLRQGGSNASGRSVPIVQYDFTCADRLGPELGAALASRHERAACDFAATLSGLGAIVDRGPRIRRHASHVCRVRARPGEPHLHCRHRGGAAGGTTRDRYQSRGDLSDFRSPLGRDSRERKPPVLRPMTEIERRLAARIVTLVLEAMRLAWQDLRAVDFKLLRVETDPSLANIALPSELVIVVRFGRGARRNSHGPMTCCIPRRGRRPLRRRAHRRGQG